jgi:hypothetical protein
MSRKKEFEKILEKSELTRIAKENLWKWYAFNENR